jgi:hypothetical protein
MNRSGNSAKFFAEPPERPEMGQVRRLSGVFRQLDFVGPPRSHLAVAAPLPAAMGDDDQQGKGERGRNADRQCDLFFHRNSSPGSCLTELALRVSPPPDIEGRSTPTPHASSRRGLTALAARNRRL